MNFRTRSFWLFIAVILCSSICQQGLAQRNSRKLTHQPDSTYKKDPLEKIHLHLDKPFYAAGDTIWFKAYLVNASNSLTEHSKVLTVELINESDELLRSIKVPLSAGLGWADFPLDEELNGGNYRIRAYTNWMRNFDEQYFFDKVVPVSDVFSNQVLVKANYSYSGKELVADLEYKNIDGSPVIEKQIGYSLQTTNKRRLNGKSITDKNGRVTLRIDTNDLSFSHNLTTSLRIDKDTISKNLTIPPVSQNFDIQFFPEGGELVTNIPSRLAFKAVAANGMGVNVSGYITDSSNSIVTSFQSEFAGMGVLGINPQQNETYIAHIKTETGIEKTIPLPKSREQGYVMTLEDQNEYLQVKIKVSYELLKENKLVLNVESLGLIHGSSRTIVDKAFMIVRVPKSRLPTGIVQLTLLSDETPVAERIAFIDNFAELDISVKLDKNRYRTKERVRMALDSKDGYGTPVLGSFSLAVLDESKVPFDEQNETTILSNLLLSSQLKGHIEKPNYYFTDRSETKTRHLDILMMTQGWRRFAQKGDTPSKLPEPNFAAEQGLYVKGRVLTPLNAPVNNAEISLLVQGTGRGFTSTRTNEKGEFSFDSLYFEDHARLVLNALTEKGKDNVKIVLDSIPEQRMSKRKVLFRDLLPSIDSAIVANSEDDYLAYLKRYIDITRTQVLNEVVVRAPKKRLVENSSNLNHRDATWTFLEEQIRNQLNLSEILQKVPAVIVKGNKAYRMRDLGMSLRGQPPPINVILDGTPMGPDLDLYNLNDFEAIEVLTNSGDIGVYGRPVILLTTKTVIKPTGPRLGQLRVIAQGYAPERQFYSPQYDAPGMDDQFRDLRSTIYWNPNILTNSRERSDVSFFTGQTPGKYKFVIEGVDEFGRLGRTVFTREIK